MTLSIAINMTTDYIASHGVSLLAFSILELPKASPHP